MPPRHGPENPRHYLLASDINSEDWATDTTTPNLIQARVASAMRFLKHERWVINQDLLYVEKAVEDMTLILGPIKPNLVMSMLVGHKYFPCPVTLPTDPPPRVRRAILDGKRKRISRLSDRRSGDAS